MDGERSAVKAFTILGGEPMPFDPAYNVAGADGIVLLGGKLFAYQVKAHRFSPDESFTHEFLADTLEGIRQASAKLGLSALIVIAATYQDGAERCFIFPAELVPKISKELHGDFYFNCSPKYFERHKAAGVRILESTSLVVI